MLTREREARREVTPPWLRRERPSHYPSDPQTSRGDQFPFQGKTLPPPLSCLVEVGTKYAFTVFIPGKSTCCHVTIEIIYKEKRTGPACVVSVFDDTEFHFQCRASASSTTRAAPTRRNTELRYAVFNIIYSFKK